MSALPWILGGVGVAGLAVWLALTLRRLASLERSAARTEGRLSLDVAKLTTERDTARESAKEFAERIEAQELIRHDAASRAQRIVADMHKEVGRLNDALRDNAERLEHHSKECTICRMCEACKRLAGFAAGERLDRILSSVPEADDGDGGATSGG